MQAILTTLLLDQSSALDKLRVNFRTWHRRLSHLGITNIIKLAKIAIGLDLENLLVP